jgi:hypothetical protein
MREIIRDDVSEHLDTLHGSRRKNALVALDHCLASAKRRA